MTPLVSVITTVFNCERYILESLESMASQTRHDFEWIIVNDGSRDKTWEIVSSFTHPSIRLVDNKSNRRIPARRNEAIEMAKGKYIAIHDGDDVSMPDRIEAQADFLESHDDIFCLGGWAYRIDENGVDQGEMTYPKTTPKQTVELLLRKRTNPVIDPTSMFRRQVFLDLGKYNLDKAIYTVPDMDLWARAILAGHQITNLPMRLIKYRVNPDGMTRKHNPEMIRAHQLVWRRFSDEFSRQLMAKHLKDRDAEMTKKGYANEG